LNISLPYRTLGIAMAVLLAVVNALWFEVQGTDPDAK
jgi:cyd operon protein YbgT